VFASSVRPASRSRNPGTEIVLDNEHPRRSVEWPSGACAQLVGVDRRGGGGRRSDIDGLLIIDHTKMAPNPREARSYGADRYCERFGGLGLRSSSQQTRENTS
jgi:hypothetical protein